VVGLYGIWHNHDYIKNFNAISADLGLAVSTDGLHFHEPVKGYRFISTQDAP